MNNGLSKKIRAIIAENFTAPEPVYNLHYSQEEKRLRWELDCNAWQVTNENDCIVQIANNYKNFIIVNGSHTVDYRSMTDSVIYSMRTEMLNCIKDAWLAKALPIPKNHKSSKIEKYPAYFWLGSIFRQDCEFDEKLADSIINIYRLLQDKSQNKTHIALALVAIYESTNKGS